MMKKQELIKGLQDFVDRDKAEWKGQRVFSQFLIEYLRRLDIPHDKKYDIWQIDHHLPQLMVDAFVELRTGTDDYVGPFREMHEAETGRKVPNVTDLGENSILDQSSTVQTTIGFLLKEVTGLGWIEYKVDTYCNAQKHVLQQTFDKFLRQVYRQGMFEIIRKCKLKGMSGIFNETTLRSYVLAGRAMFTFARGNNGHEISVSFIAQDGDRLGLSAGIQSVRANFYSALSMIEDVVDCWPDDEKQQLDTFKPDERVSII